MTLSYTTGLTVGSLFAYILDTGFELPIQSKDVCFNALNSSVMPLNYTTPNILTTIMSSALPTLENVTPKVKTTVTVLSTILTSTLMSNNTTVSTLTSGVMEASTTISPKMFVNVTASVNNAILQH